MEFLHITLTGWVALSIAISMAFLSVLMFILGNERAHYVWGAFCLAVAVWAGGFYMVSLTSDASTAKFWWKIAYIGIILNPFLYFQFSLEFIENSFFFRHRWIITFLVNAVALVFLALDLFTDLIIKGVTVLFGQLYYNTPPGAAYTYFMILFPLLICVSLYLIIREYRIRKTDTLFRQRAMYFFIASAVAYVGGSMNFLPIYGIQVNPITNSAVAFGAVFIAYAILRRGLFNMRVVTAQFLTLILVIFSLVRLAISSSTQEFLVNIFILVVTLIVGIYLIRSVRKEVQQRERIEQLAKDLEIANERLKELDKMKSEFVSIASHQLRSPLTAIKGYASLVLEGSFGAVNDAVREAVQKIFDSSSLMAVSVQDFLDVSRIEQGRMQYNFEVFDLAKLAKTVVEELTPEAQKKRLALTLTVKDGAPFRINADLGKMKQVLNNLIDNSLKYTPKGSVDVVLFKRDGKIEVEIRDTGVGIDAATLPKLFDKFVRSRNAHHVNVSGTGLGLFVVKEMMKAHKGRVWATSEGKGKGSVFHVELHEYDTSKGLADDLAPGLEA